MLNKKINEIDNVAMEKVANEIEKAMCPPAFGKMSRDELEESILVELQELKVEMRKLIDQKNNGKG